MSQLPQLSFMDDEKKESEVEDIHVVDDALLNHIYNTVISSAINAHDEELEKYLREHLSSVIEDVLAEIDNQNKEARQLFQQERMRVFLAREELLNMNLERDLSEILFYIEDHLPAKRRKERYM